MTEQWIFLKHRRIPNIRSRLVWLIAACIAPAFLMAAALLYVYYEREQNQLIRDAVATERALSFALDRELVSLETTLLALAGSVDLKSSDLEAFDRQARVIVQDRRIDNIVLTDLHAQQLVNTRQAWGRPLPLYGSPDLVQRVVDAQKPVISDLFIGRLVGKPLTSIGVPVRQGGALSAVLLGTIEPQRFADILLQQGLPDDQVAGVLDRSGALIARTPELAGAIGHPGPTELVEQLKTSGRGQLEATTLDGRAALTLYGRSEKSGWTVYVAVPRESLAGDLWRTLGWMMAATALLLLATLSMAWRLGGKITRAIRALDAPALALGEGKSLNVPALPIREVDELGKALVKASDMLSQANTARRRGEARMQGILESAMDAIITVDDSHTILVFNSAASAMFGCPVEQAIGLPLTRFIPERFHARHADYVEQHRDTETPPDAFGVAGIASAVRISGEEFPVEVSYSNVVESDAVLHTLIIRDVTARVRAYKALERSNLDLQQFAYVASHDLKTPLRSIGGFVQLLERNHADKLDEKALSLIRRTAAAVKRLEQLTEDLLSYARIDAEVKQFGPVDMAEVAQEVVHLLDAAINTADAAVTIHEMPVVLGDRTQLAQLLLNLVGNSIKYCRDRAPVVEVSAAQKDQEWVFSVKDNGIGIDPKHHAKVFEVFKRLHSQSDFPGTGIGLAVCRRVVEGHGGKIWITSPEGGGSIFSFTLPDNLRGTPDEA